LLEENIHEEKLLKSIKIISEQIVKCQRTVRNLLDFSRKSDCERKLYGIHSLIDNTLVLIEHRLIINKIKLHKTFDAQVPSLLVEGNQIQQVILNLINNAIDALPNGGNIRIVTRLNTEQRSVEIVFEDDGIGISIEDQSRVFTPFFTTKEPGKGTGLGLSICNHIISAHGGKIMLESSLGKGTRFVILLPVP
jgi:signal transduction histidine kinase